MAVYPARLRLERDCLNCGEPFPPGPGWQAIYCSLACWRANNGGPRLAARPAPVVIALDPYMPRADVDRREAFVQKVAAELDQLPTRRLLVVVAREHCPRCGVDHDIYGMTDG